MIKISVITVVYNGKQYIKEAIENVLGQTYKNIEFIVVDGASTDGTVEIIKKYAKKIDIFISEKDRGIYDAMNKGLKIATGDVVVFHNADDLYADKNVLKLVAETFQKHSVESVYGDLVYVHPQKTDKIIRYWKAGRFSNRALFTGWMPPHPSLFVRREIAQKSLFKIKLWIAADYEFCLKLFGKFKISSYYIPKVLVKMRHGGKSSKNLWRILQSFGEDYHSWLINWPNYQVLAFFATTMKKLRKIPQFLALLKTGLAIVRNRSVNFFRRSRFFTGK